MGALCSRSSKHDHGQNNKYAKTKTGSPATVKKNNSSNLTKLQVQDSKQEVPQPIVAHYEIDGTGTGGAAATEDDFYDGIPRYNAASLKSRSIRSKQAAVAKVLLLFSFSFLLFVEFNNMPSGFFCMLDFFYHYEIIWETPIEIYSVGRVASKELNW